MVGRNICGVELEHSALSIAHQHLFAPVAKDVATKTRVRLGAIVESSVETLNNIHPACFPIVFLNCLMVEKFAKQVAIPPDAEVCRHSSALIFVHGRLFVFCRSDEFALDISYASAIGTPHLQTFVGRVNIGSHTSAHIKVAWNLEDHFACGSIAEVATIAAILVTVPHLQLIAIRIESHQVQGIAMTEACVVESTTIVVNSHRTVCYFVAAIAINISHSEVVVALTSIACPLRIVCVEDPTAGEILSVPIPGSNNCASVISTAEESRSLFAIEISYACKIAL